MFTTSAEQLTIQCCTASRKLDFAKNCLDKFLEKPNLINISLGLRDLIKSTLEDCVILECGVIWYSLDPALSIYRNYDTNLHPDSSTSRFLQKTIIKYTQLPVGTVPQYCFKLFWYFGRDCQFGVSWISCYQIRASG